MIAKINTSYATNTGGKCSSSDRGVDSAATTSTTPSDAHNARRKLAPAAPVLLGTAAADPGRASFTIRCTLLRGASSRP
ncbi:hypothetical protein GCM10023169_25050 [Georgenia halophila]|uniref:Uncharacterized protein n=1 Tax=Georgenia halophila TaxID=620889 RepID=A0ABP8LB65_9MICO